jgi:hypothetical protein
MNTLPLKMDIEATLVSTPLRFKIQVEDVTLYDNEIAEQQSVIEVDIPDSIDYSLFTLKLELYGKTDEHSVMENGISNTASITINTLSIDDLSLIGVDGVSGGIHHTMKYTHDYNGSAEKVTEPFTNHMGCNGVQTIVMYTPMHICLYEYNNLFL